jgi:putative acyl-CoA dehydrogenase
MECLGGNGYVEDSLLPRLYREAPVNAIWEGSGNVMCLDVLRACARERDAAQAMLDRLAADTKDLAGRDGAIAHVRRALADPHVEARARAVVERLALVAATAALRAGALDFVTDTFARARLSGRSGSTYGASLPADAERRRVLDRALPPG